MTGLPLQNVVVICALLYGGEIGVERLNSPDWKMVVEQALMWVVAVLAARAVARRWLRRYRGTRYFGMTMMAAASLMTAAVQLIELHAAWSVAMRFSSTFLLLLLTAPWFVRKDQFSTPLSS